MRVVWESEGLALWMTEGRGVGVDYSGVLCLQSFSTILLIKSML